MTTDTAAAVARCVTPERLQVLRALVPGERERGELRAATGLPRTQLVGVLKELEARDLVASRTEELDMLETAYQCSQTVTGSVVDEPGQPVERYYALTEKGASLEPVFDAVESWADDWLDEGGDEPAATDG